MARSRRMTVPFRQRIGQVRDAVTLWFFAKEVPYSLALVRIVLPLTLLVGAIPRWLNARELYSLDGVPTPFWEAYGVPQTLPLLPGPLAVGLYTVLVGCLIAASLGWHTRLALLSAAVLYPYFGMIDTLGTLTKYTVIGTHALLLLGLSDCGAVWSLDRWLDGGASARPRRSSCWPRRLIQLLIGVVYLGSAATKVHIPVYFSGDHLNYWMLSNENFPNPLGEWLSLFPATLMLFSYITVVWEVLFIFLVWRGFGRICMLTLGAAFHLLTYGTLGLVVFPLVYLALYAVFLHNHEAAAVGRFVSQFIRRRLPQRFSWPAPPVLANSLPVFGAALLVMTFAGMAAEAQMNRGLTQRRELVPLPEEQAQQMLRNDLNVELRDNVFGYDVGTILLGDVLANRRSEFHYGEKAIIQCRFVRPHSDLVVEVNLHDGQNRIVERNGEIAGREDARTTFYYRMSPSLVPGDYQFVLKLDGHEVARKKITLTGTPVSNP